MEEGRIVWNRCGIERGDDYTEGGWGIKRWAVLLRTYDVRHAGVNVGSLEPEFERRLAVESSGIGPSRRDWVTAANGSEEGFLLPKGDASSPHIVNDDQSLG